MIHKNLGYGYAYDDETKTLIGEDYISSYGFFSTFTLMIVTIINVYKDLKTTVEYIDGRNLLKNLSGNENIDMYHHFFKIDKDFIIDFDERWVHPTLNPNEHHSIYKEENIKLFKPFFQKYFGLNERVSDKLNYFKTKYNIDSENSLSVIYRDTDKWTDLGGFNYISPAFYFRIAKNIKTQNPELQVLIQTENIGVKNVFKHGLGAISIEETLTCENPESPIFLTLKNDKLEWADAYICSLWIHSKSKYLITYTGNSAFFVYLSRGTTEKMYQEITFTKNNENDFFVLNA